MNAYFGKKKIKRRKSGQKPYFGKEQHNAIVLYQTLTNQDEKNDLYINIIKPAFEKLSENLIMMHGFSALYCSYEELQSDCVAFLYKTIYKFKPEKGTKAFSYFNIVAKNFLIIENKKKNALLQKNLSLEEQTFFDCIDEESYNNYITVPSPDEQMIERDLNKDIYELLLQVRSRLKKDTEIKIIDSILFIFKNIEHLDLYNKNALFYYIREMTNSSAKQLTSSLAAIKKYYNELRGDEDFGLFH